MAKHRWIIERDYQEVKLELGLGHFEGRNWRGFHHHATLCIAAYGFLVAERSLFFFLSPRWKTRIPQPKASPELPAARLAPSGIIRIRLPRCDPCLHGYCSVHSLSVPSVEPAQDAYSDDVNGTFRRDVNKVGTKRRW